MSNNTSNILFQSTGLHQLLHLISPKAAIVSWVLELRRAESSDMAAHAVGEMPS